MSAASSARRTVVIGVVSAGFSTTVLPAASAGPNLPDRHHQRVVPRRDLPDHADRLAAGEGRVALHVLARGPALQAAGGAREEAKVVGHHRDLVVFGGFDRLARVQRLQARELIAVLLDQVGQCEQRLGTLGGRRARPALESAARSAHRAVHLLGGRARRPRDLLAGRGVQDGFALPLARAGLAVDEVAECLYRARHRRSWFEWVDCSVRTGRQPAAAGVRPSASATAGWVIWPARTFRPMRSPGLRSSAPSTPRSASSITYGRVALVSA